MSVVVAEFREEDRQLALLALAELALSRPGFNDALEVIADKFGSGARAMFGQFKEMNAGRVRATHSPLDKRLGPNVDSIRFIEEDNALSVDKIVELARQLIPVELPVDRSKQCMTDGSPVAPDHREIDPATGMQKGYVALCPDERAKGFVRPARHEYRHLKCGVVTHMGDALAETYARDPQFYSGTFCVGCRTHFPLDEFVWDGTSDKLGT